MPYLKELVILKARAPVYGLPFHTEVCERTETNLKAEPRKPIERTNAHIQCIMSLLSITQVSVGNSLLLWETGKAWWSLKQHGQSKGNKWIR